MNVFLAEEPHATCGGSSTGAAFNRPDLFCEMMLWQSENLGDGDEAEYKKNGCPWPGKLVEAPARHQGHLHKVRWQLMEANFYPNDCLCSAISVMHHHDASG